MISRTGGKCSAFAGDVKTYIRVTSENDCRILQDALNVIAEWSCIWNLPLSTEKTTLLHLGCRNPKFDYQIEGSVLRKFSNRRIPDFSSPEILVLNATAKILLARQLP